MGYLIFGLVLTLVAGALSLQGQDSGATLQRAYDALAAKDYATAIRSFEDTLKLDPSKVNVHLDVAYTLLKIGDTESARDHFGTAAKLDPANDRAALEYAFLCYETRQPVAARRTFDRLRNSAQSPQDRETAAKAFENIDAPLREGIARWTQALAASPDNFSAHEELARLAEQRDELPLSVEHYKSAWILRQDRRGLLVDLARVLAQVDGGTEESIAALLAASRGPEPRIAEEARDRLPDRYPFPYEFERALTLDPTNVDLRREYAYLRLQIGDVHAAEEQFTAVLNRAPADRLSKAQLGFLQMNRGDQRGAVLLEQVLAERVNDEVADRIRSVLRLAPFEPRPSGSGQPDRKSTCPEHVVCGPSEAKLLGERSLEKGYLKDALKYLQLAHEEDPVDFRVMLNLGKTYNILKDDASAVRWFDLARRSPDPATAREARRAYGNLMTGIAPLRTTLWMFPMFSTRWHDAFTYAQIKTEFLPASWPVHPYLSLRFIGDVRDKVTVNAALGPQYLSERSAIAALGVATRSWNGLVGWFEAGEAFRYRVVPGDTGRVVPDYRGGVAFGKGFGHLLASGSKGAFGETNDDAVFVSRFSNDTLFYSQNRTGYTFPAFESAGGFHVQLYMNWNVTADVQRQPWANFAEAGPGFKFRFDALPQSLEFSVNALHGVYLVKQDGIRKANFNDLRIGIWYAISR